MLPRTILAWFVLYLIVTGSLAIFFSILAVFLAELGGSTLLFIYAGVLLILIGIGIVSLLPLSEYAYTRQAGLNPMIARESMQHLRRKRERRGIGILLGVTGVTTILGINPWVTFSSLLPLFGLAIAIVLMTVALALLVAFYRRYLHQYIRSDNS